MTFLFDVAVISINIRKSKELRELVKLYWDQYKLDSRDFIKKDTRLDFIWSLNEIQLARENLNILDKNINAGVIRYPEQLEKEYYFKDIEESLEKLPKYITNYKEFPFFDNIFGLYVFFQQLFNINYSRIKEKTARYFVRNHPEVIQAYIISPESLVFAGREILQEESKNQAKPPGTNITVSGKVYVTYPRFTNPSLIKTEIKRCIRSNGIKTYVDITRELLTLELHPEILESFKLAKTSQKSTSLSLPQTCNPFVMLLLLSELCS